MDLKKKINLMNKKIVELTNQNIFLQKRNEEVELIYEKKWEENKIDYDNFYNLIYNEKKNAFCQKCQTIREQYKNEISSLELQYSNNISLFSNNYTLFKSEIHVKLKKIMNDFIEKEKKMLKQLEEIKYQKQIFEQKKNEELLEKNKIIEKLSKNYQSQPDNSKENTKNMKNITDENSLLKQQIKQMTNLKAQVNIDLQKEINQLHSEIDKYKELYTLNKNNNEILSKQFDSLKQKHSKNEEKIKNISQIEQNLKNDLSNKEKYYTYIIKTNEQKHQAQIEKFKKENDQLKTKYLKYQIDCETEIKSLQQEVENQKNLIEKYLKQINVLKQKNENINEEKLEKIENQSKQDNNNDKFEKEKMILQSKHREEINHLNFANLLQVNEIKIKYEQTISDLKIENSYLKSEIETNKDRITKLLHEKSLQYRKLSINSSKMKINKEKILSQIEKDEEKSPLIMKNKDKSINYFKPKETKESRNSKEVKSTRRKRNPFSISEGMLCHNYSESQTLVPIDVHKSTRFSVGKR